MRAMPLDEAKRIATGGLSFQIVAESGLFPPRDVLNAFFNCGYDDENSDDVAEEGVLRWEPFALSPEEFDELCRWWREGHPEARTDGLSVRGADFSEWFTRASETEAG